MSITSIPRALDDRLTGRVVRPRPRLPAGRRRLERGVDAPAGRIVVATDGDDVVAAVRHAGERRAWESPSRARAGVTVPADETRSW